MAEANGMDRGTTLPRLSRRLAGLLLAGSTLATVTAAHAQETTATDPTMAFSTPVTTTTTATAATTASTGGTVQR